MKIISIIFIFLFLFFFIVISDSLKLVNVIKNEFTNTRSGFCDPHFQPDKGEFYDQNCTYGCQSYTDHIDFVVSCKDDEWVTAGVKHSKTEGGSSHIQRPHFEIQTCYHIYRSANVSEGMNYLILHQRVTADTRSMIVNNPSEHVAFFNTRVQLENSILNCDNCEVVVFSPTPLNNNHTVSDTSTTTKGFNLDLTGGGDSNGASGSTSVKFSREKSVSNTIVNSIKDWSIGSFTIEHGRAWEFYQTYPFDATTSNSKNFGTWFRNSIEAKFKDLLVDSKMRMLPLSELSKREFTSDVLTIFSIPQATKGIKVHTKYSHFLGNVVSGSHFIDAMRYREYEFTSNFTRVLK